jgi:hypothetical protein
MNITEFLEKLIEEKWFYAIKRLSGNDTGLTGGHQAGIYLPRWFFEKAIPSICRTDRYNPRAEISEMYFPNDDHRSSGVQAIYYNSKYHPNRGLIKKYDEFRMTRWGGQESPLQNPDRTGDIAIFAVKGTGGDFKGMVWLCGSKEEEAIVEGWIGWEVFPGEVYGPLHSSREMVTGRSVSLADRIMQAGWFEEFPTGEEIFNKVVEALPMRGNSRCDDLLMKRRELEYAVFMKIEEIHVGPRIAEGFKSVDEFFQYSLAAANRRKSRTGRSLELNLAKIFSESGLRFESQARTEHKKRPDFLFPSGEDYANPEFPADKLQMMAAKTCCKDRWRQVQSEANRIAIKHLFTLQEGLSENQYAEMKSAGVALVTPVSNHKCFPVTFRDELLSLQDFVALVARSQEVRE